MTMKSKKPAAKRAVTKRTMTQVREEVESSGPVDQKFAEFQKSQQQETLAAVSGISVDKTVQSLTQVNLEVGRTLSEVQQKIIEQVSQLQKINEAIDLKQEELQALYDKESILEETRSLIQAYDERLQDFTEERIRIEKQLEEFKLEQRKLRDREEQDYRYTRDLQRRKADDDFNATDKTRLNSLVERQEQFEKTWKLREETLASKETEFQKYKEQVEAFPEKLKVEINAATAIATSGLKRELNHEFTLQKANLESQLNMAKAEIANSNKVIAAQDQEIQRLRASLADANQKVVDIARDGFSSVSGQRSLEALQSFSAGQQGQAKAKS